jgi:hypothetical protein
MTSVLTLSRLVAAMASSSSASAHQRRCVTGGRRCAMQASKSSSEHFTAVGKLSAEVFTGQRPARGRRWLDEIVTGVATESKDCRARKMQYRNARFISHRSGQSSHRRSPAARAWSRPSLRFPGRVVASDWILGPLQRLEAGLCGPAKSRVLGEQQEISFSAGVRGGPVGSSNDLLFVKRFRFLARPPSSFVLRELPYYPKER